MDRNPSDLHRKRGFTLIELLVVVAVIALLIAILLPSMQLARAQAKRVVCQNNMSQVAKAVLSYIYDLDQIPLQLSFDASGNQFGWCSWSYGGWAGSNRDYYRTQYAGGKYYIPTNRRPVSAYMFAGHSLGEFDELPVFRCPSDQRSTQGNNDNPGRRLSAYEDVGTSFHINFHWWDRARAGGSLEGWSAELKRGAGIWNAHLSRDTSRFVILFEDPADFGLATSLQAMGFHKEFSKHNYAFLDGHVQYLYTDTRQRSGRDWTVIDEQQTGPESGQ